MREQGGEKGMDEIRTGQDKWIESITNIANFVVSEFRDRADEALRLLRLWVMRGGSSDLPYRPGVRYEAVLKSGQTVAGVIVDLRRADFGIDWVVLEDAGGAAVVPLSNIAFIREAALPARHEGRD